MTGSIELAQALQSVRGGYMRKFNYENPVKNKRLYGRVVPPRYNAARIISRDLAIWSANTDILVPAESGDVVTNEMTGM